MDINTPLKFLLNSNDLLSKTQNISHRFSSSLVSLPASELFQRSITKSWSVVMLDLEWLLCVNTTQRLNNNFKVQPK